MWCTETWIPQYCVRDCFIVYCEYCYAYMSNPVDAVGINYVLIGVCYLAVSRFLLILDIEIMVISERLSSKKAESNMKGLIEMK